MMAQPEQHYQHQPDQQMHYAPQQDYTNYGQPLVGDPAAMARAMGQACEAGRTAFLAGRLPKRAQASASSPRQGLVGH